MTRAGKRPRFDRRLLAVVALTLLQGCGVLERPPIELSYRASLLGAGTIVQIENTSNESLVGLEVTVTAPNGESRTFAQDRLAGYQSVEIGWKRLGGWEIPPGSEVRVRAKGHFLAFDGRLPEEDAGE